MVGKEEFQRGRLLHPTRASIQNSLFKNAKSPSFLTGFSNVVGEEGFEPPTLWSQTRCATKLRYSPSSQ